MPFTTYSGGKMYRLSEAGVAAGTAVDYTSSLPIRVVPPLLSKLWAVGIVAPFPLPLLTMFAMSRPLI